MALAAGYFVVLLVLVETLRRHVHLASDVTRKIFLVGTGAWALVAVRLFEDKGSAVLVYGALAVLLYLSFRLELFVGIEDAGPSLGPVFLALTSASLLAFFWNGRVEIAVAAIVGAAFGDAAATLIGRRFGTRKFHSFAHMRSMEGTLAMFLASGLVMAPILAGSGRVRLAPSRRVLSHHRHCGRLGRGSLGLRSGQPDGAARDRGHPHVTVSVHSVAVDSHAFFLRRDRLRREEDRAVDGHEGLVKALFHFEGDLVIAAFVNLKELALRSFDSERFVVNPYITLKVHEVPFA